MRSAGCPRVLGGWLAGCGAATVVIYAFLLTFVWMLSGNGSAWPMRAWAFVLPGIFAYTVVLSGIPAALTIWLSRRFRLRSFAFFGCAGGAIGVLGQFALFQSFAKFGPLFVVAGLAAGLTYWFVAGRRTGGESA